MTKRYCDRCGRHITGGEWWGIVGMYRDLCRQCYTGLRTAMERTS